MKRYTLITMIIVLTATFAIAQFPIKIPEIKIPKIEQPKTETPRQSTQATRSNEPQQTINNERIGQPKISNSLSDNPAIGKAQNRQMVMNDGYTFFSAKEFKRYERNKIPGFKNGWYLEPSLQILGTFPISSAFRILVKKNGKVLSNVRCEGRIYKKADDSKYKTPSARAGKVDMNFEDTMTTGSKCEDKKKPIREVGKLDVEVYFVDGDTDNETLVRKYIIDVKESTKVKGRQENPVPDYSDYYIQRHPETAVARLHLKKLYSSGKENAQLVIHTSISSDGDTTKFVSILRNAFTRCSVNGQRLEFGFDKIFAKSQKDESAIYIDRKAAKYKKQATPYREVIQFKTLSLAFPIQTGDISAPDRPKLEDRPGKWECSVISDGKTHRKFRWEVGADGRVVPHAEQTTGNINLEYNTFLIDTEIPAGGSPFDIRLMPMPEMGLFYGIRWTTAEGKAMAARVPTKGSPGPVPSDKQK